MNEEDVKKFAKNEADRIINHIVYLRKKKGITQENLAERSAISRSTVGQIEKGAVKISLVTFTAILKGLDVSYSEFFDEFEQEKRVVEETSPELVDLIKEVDIHPNRMEFIAIIQSLLKIK
ncbi:MULTISPECIES: helix-turn-helix domain-containing protein [unclassified Enterococcus]|uniref:helix-turn-helix domain-containing protein n=1 Tax=unclassified Enterococcus TaxID=2608891 RepID=UPI001CE0B1B4|nr:MULTISPECIES: helix-turn-helix transcriptional regulator [unclassified Enterococcus]MCA5014403.1 helix-turn-helix transcriptional regulator [Enterococcus sp. S23]MCA5017484.1 helix-turn-helix transcriptional regulator [Enterococcus sp. S22(2020)]